MQQEEHTKEPWEFIYDSVAPQIAEIRAVPNKPNKTSAFVTSARPKDAERICITINACKDVPSEWLEQASLWRFYQMMAAIVPTLTISQIEAAENSSELNMSDIVDQAKVISQQMAAHRTLSAASGEPGEDIPF